MRVKRGTLRSTREGGRLYVLLHTDPTPGPDRPHARDNDRTDELIRTLQEQLEAERQAHAEARRSIAGLVERVPALEPPAEPVPPSQTRESPESASEPHPSTKGSPEPEPPAEVRPWWRRMFGG